LRIKEQETCLTLQEHDDDDDDDDHLPTCSINEKQGMNSREAIKSTIYSIWLTSSYFP